MQLYSCRVRLKGSLLNTVNKEHVTAAEIRLLDFIHQGDNPAVYDVCLERDVARTDKAERERLAHLYGEFMGASGSEVVNRVLGVPGVALPQKLDEGDERIVADNGIFAARKASVAGKKAPKADPLFDLDGPADEAPAENDEPSVSPSFAPVVPAQPVVRARIPAKKDAVAAALE